VARSGSSSSAQSVRPGVLDMIMLGLCLFLYQTVVQIFEKGYYSGCSGEMVIFMLQRLLADNLR